MSKKDIIPTKEFQERMSMGTFRFVGTKDISKEK